MYAFCKLGSVPPKCIPLLCEDASCDECPPGALVKWKVVYTQMN